MCPEAPTTAPDATNENIRNTTLGRDSSIVRSSFKLLSIDFNFRGCFPVPLGMLNGVTPAIDRTLFDGEGERLYCFSIFCGVISSSK